MKSRRQMEKYNPKGVLLQIRSDESSKIVVKIQQYYITYQHYFNHLFNMHFFKCIKKYKII